MKDTRTEHEIQADFMAWWSQAPRPGVLFAIPNGGFRSARTGVLMKAEGALSGVPDLFYANVCKGRPGLFLEFKRSNPKGRLSDAQKALFPRLEAAGYPIAVVYSGAAAMAAIDHYLNGGAFGPFDQDLGQWEKKH